MSTTHNVPQGDLVLRTLAMPADTNANGDIFGGWLMSQMDIGGAILAKEIAHGRVVTVRVEGMTFLRPVAVGDVVCCYARCVQKGTTSVSINIEVWVKKVMSEMGRAMMGTGIADGENRAENAAKEADMRIRGKE